MSVTKQRLIASLNQDRPRRLLPPAAGDAAVALVVSNWAQPSVMLCVKASHLRSHAGEVSLPGGKVDPDDTDSLDASLRELREETAIRLSREASIGALDQLYSLHGLRVTPHVFWHDSPLAGVPNEPEIARVFQCPLDRILQTPDGFEQSRHRDLEGHWMPRWMHEGEVIWGLTALILANFRARALDCPVNYPKSRVP